MLFIKKLKNLAIFQVANIKKEIKNAVKEATEAIFKNQKKM